MDPMGIYYGNPVCLPGVFSTAVTCRNGIPWVSKPNGARLWTWHGRRSWDPGTLSREDFFREKPYDGENLAPSAHVRPSTNIGYLTGLLLGFSFRVLVLGFSFRVLVLGFSFRVLVLGFWF